ncbi:MAG: ligase-associated DNA damage response exonuclease [Bacteroidetes bacterium]|nr:ligase-associated DNA damage response exonuclease [Bacteroidota bacterium]
MLTFTDKGIYCAQGDFYIDPWQPVNKAVITHAHSDHARAGCENYLCHRDTVPLLQLRLGNNNYQSVEWGESILMNGVKVSLHPAGHIIGSSQIRVEYNGDVWVVSGDYKTENDGISGAIEIVKCNVFITESTFGLPIYNWKSQQEIFTDIQNWIIKNKREGKNSVLIGYSLGKAQRLLPCVKAVSENVFVHGAIWNVHETLINAGFKLPSVKRVTPDMSKEAFKEAVIIAPPSADGSPWLKRFSNYEIGVCSGWMQVRGNYRRRNADAGFALSDHADWKGLLQVTKETGAHKVFATHGFQSVFSRYLNEIGIEAAEVKTEFGEEEAQAVEEEKIKIE